MTALAVGNIDRPAEQIDRPDPTCLYVIVNGPLGMGAGKLAGQTFQAAMWLFTHPEISAEQRQALASWQAEGARVIVRVAETDGMWQRVISELDGIVLRDEGLTDVQHGTGTVFCCWPVKRSQAPKLLANKKIPLA